MEVRPGRAAVAGAGLALTLALVAAALAWSRPKLAENHPVEAGASATGALRISGSRGEGAILRAPALAPGGSVAGSLTIRNLGATARLTLSRRHLVDTAAVGERSLAEALRLNVRDHSAGSSPLVYRGLLAAMPPLQLGQLAAGESRRYRFVAFLPEPGLVDNSLMGAGVSFDYRWHLRRQ